MEGEYSFYMKNKVILVFAFLKKKIFLNEIFYMFRNGQSRICFTTQNLIEKVVERKVGKHRQFMVKYQ